MNASVLAQLMAQGADGGADLATLRAIAEEAGELGASRALTLLGLADEAAHRDLAELRELLKAWRDAKRSAVHPRAVRRRVLRAGRRGSGDGDRRDNYQPPHQNGYSGGEV